MPSPLNIDGYAWTLADQEFVEQVGYSHVCLSSNYAIPLFEGGDLLASLETSGYTCYMIAELRAMLTQELPPPDDGGGGGSAPPPSDGGGGGPVTDPGIPDLPPPAEIPPVPPPLELPPPIVTVPEVIPPFPVLFPGVQIGAGGVPFLPGSTITARLFNGLGSFLGSLLGGILGGNADAKIDRLRYDMVNVTNALWNAIKALGGVVHATARGAGALAKVIHDIWHKGIKPVLDHIKEIGQRISKIIDKVLKPYLLWMQRMRKLILDIYVKIVLPILNLIQGIRKALALLRLAHVPFAKKLDERLQRLEAKITRPIQVLLQRVNDHGGIINEIISIQRVLQEPLFTRSVYSYQYSLVNSWWASQTVPRTAQQQHDADALKLLAESNAGKKTLDNFLVTDVYEATTPNGPGVQALDDLLQRRTP
jgi:hypothetical protein